MTKAKREGERRGEGGKETREGEKERREGKEERKEGGRWRGEREHEENKFTTVARSEESSESLSTSCLAVCCSATTYYIKCFITVTPLYISN